MTFKIVPRNAAKYLLIFTSVLLFLNILSIIYRLNRISLHQNQDSDLVKNILYHFMYYFDLNHEGSISNLFSTALLMLSSILLTCISIVESKKLLRFYWKLLAVVFLFMCLDEFLGFHELLINPLRSSLNTSGLLFFAWVIPYGVAVIVFALIFIKFLIKLPRKTAYILVLSGITYVLGALVMEMPEGWVAEKYGYHDKWVWIMSSIQETLEILGLIIFIYALTSYKSFVLKIN